MNVYEKWRAWAGRTGRDEDYLYDRLAQSPAARRVWQTRLY